IELQKAVILSPWEVAAVAVGVLAVAGLGGVLLMRQRQLNQRMGFRVPSSADDDDDLVMDSFERVSLDRRSFTGGSR
ncbi:hypothetical protein HK405_003128, partial [Cladochytrium tenue]